MSWETFLELHWGAIAAADLFGVETLTHRGLSRHLVFFVIDLKSRRVKFAGIAPEPSSRWIAQMARIVGRDALRRVQREPRHRGAERLAP